MRDLDQMKANVASGAEQVLDARGAARFTGEEPDPRGLAAGPYPGLANLPYDRLFNADGTLEDAARRCRPRSTRRASISTRPLVTTCGSGVTAAVLLFGAAPARQERARSTTASGANGAPSATPKGDSAPA